MANPTFTCSHMDDHMEIVTAGDLNKVINSWGGSISDRNSDEKIYFVTNEQVSNFKDKIKEMEDDK